MAPYCWETRPEALRRQIEIGMAPGKQNIGMDDLSKMEAALTLLF